MCFGITPVIRCGFPSSGFPFRERERTRARAPARVFKPLSQPLFFLHAFRKSRCVSDHPRAADNPLRRYPPFTCTSTFTFTTSLVRCAEETYGSFSFPCSFVGRSPSRFLTSCLEDATSDARKKKVSCNREDEAGASKTGFPSRSLGTRGSRGKNQAISMQDLA